MPVRDYVYRGTTRSLCPECLRVVDAKILVRGKRVYFRKQCPVHGTREDFVCSDVDYFDRHDFDQPARAPAVYGTKSDKGCPHDCGLCPEHEQHTCIGLIEITSSCNLRCPMCFAESGPGGKHIDFDTYTKMVDRYVGLEGIADVLQLSGGEPTLHPELVRMVEYAYAQPIQVVMINTNGIRLAKDRELLEKLAPMRDRLEIYLQFDGFSAHANQTLRGEDLIETKLAALDRLREYDIRCTLVCTVEHTANIDEVGKVLKFGLERTEVRGVSYQLATYCGRHLPAADLEKRITMPDLAKALVIQTEGLVTEEDFYPLPCAHPNCHRIAYLYRDGETVVPVSRIIDPRPYMDLIANSIVYTPARARNLVARAVADCGCGPAGCGTPAEGAEGFIERALAGQLTGKDVFRVTLTGFLDSYTFDTRRVMKCCLAHILPSGHIVPFCAYNTLYRDGTLKLPALSDTAFAAKPAAATAVSLPMMAGAP